jgi:hypothetical protein
MVLFPPPACTLTDGGGGDDEAAGVPLPPLLLCANAIFAMVMTIAIALPVNSIVMILACCFLFINNFIQYRIDSILFKKN